MIMGLNTLCQYSATKCNGSENECNMSVTVVLLIYYRIIQLAISKYVGMLPCQASGRVFQWVDCLCLV